MTEEEAFSKQVYIVFAGPQLYGYYPTVQEAAQACRDYRASEAKIVPEVFKSMLPTHFLAVAKPISLLIVKAPAAWFSE